MYVCESRGVDIRGHYGHVPQHNCLTLILIYYITCAHDFFARYLYFIFAQICPAIAEPYRNARIIGHWNYIPVATRELIEMLTRFRQSAQAGIGAG